MLQYLVNKPINKKGATMVELMAMLAILGLGVTAMFSVVTSGIYFAKDTEDTVKAINIAREGIEGVTNIRNTNWLRFSSDRTNCWKIKDYLGTSCIGITLNNISPLLINTSSNTLYSNNGLWYLSGVSLTAFETQWPTYSAIYSVYQDAEGFFFQTGATDLPICTATIQSNCRTIFTREIQITVPDPTNLDTIFVKSTVRWNTKRKQKIELTTTLTNWKAKF